MDAVSLLVCRHAPRAAALLGGVVALALLLTLLASAVLAALGDPVQPQAHDLLLGPWRWETLPAGLA